MKSALLGCTGFVGSTLVKQVSFNDTYNTKNIASIDGKEYDLVVCAAAPGSKWLANKNHKEDWVSISVLIDHLKRTKINQFVLISTVDVYPRPVNVDETTTIDPEQNTSYGQHRFLLEEFVSKSFSTHIIVRLPGIFGEGIKKNIIYDFIHSNETDKIHPKSQFQFYNLAHLWDDIQTAIEADINLMNIVTEPVSTREIYEAVFGKPFLNMAGTAPVVYDVRSIHATLYGGNHYMFDKKTMLHEIRNFIVTQRSKL